MLDYSGRGTFNIKPTSLNDRVMAVVELLRNSTSRRIRIETDLADSLPPVTADATQLTHVISQLLTNAIEAIGSEEGVVRISTAEYRTDGKDAETFIADSRPKGSYVRLRIEDDGEGMDEATRQQAFDPFFSTRFVGRGLGLGSVLGIVRGHCGAVRLTSVLGDGSAIDVLLPMASEAPKDTARSEQADRTPELAGAVLLVDDAPAVLESVGRILKHRGHDVLCADTGQAAIDAAKASTVPLQAAVVDLIMPEMDGYETAAGLRELYPGLPVIFCSGYPPANTDNVADIPGDGPVHFLRKPFDSDTLNALLRDVSQ
jgi:CheY-like chemotaxis protein